jgi:hypothetical protein
MVTTSKFLVRMFCVLESHSARLQQAEAGMHEEDKHRRQQHPNGVQSLIVVGRVCEAVRVQLRDPQLQISDVHHGK